MNIKTKINKKNIIALLLIVVFTIVCFICYGELRTNREVPKRAKYVGNFLLGGDNYR